MLTQGTVLQNRYRIVQPLGAGGQGAVYLALHLGLNAYVAIRNLESDTDINICILKYSDAQSNQRSQFPSY
ncbi:MAG TPA: hypothetical protein VFD70_18315 [Anaerolineae bacterium]|nr:hypothetical protein [Anaerolineae bacterium]